MSMSESAQSFLGSPHKKYKSVECSWSNSSFTSTTSECWLHDRFSLSNNSRNLQTVHFTTRCCRWTGTLEIQGKGHWLENKISPSRMPAYDEGSISKSEHNIYGFSWEEHQCVEVTQDLFTFKWWHPIVYVVWRCIFISMWR